MLVEYSDKIKGTLSFMIKTSTVKIFYCEFETLIPKWGEGSSSSLLQIWIFCILCSWFQDMNGKWIEYLSLKWRKSSSLQIIWRIIQVVLCTSLAVQCVFLHLLAVQLLATSTLTRRVITYIIIKKYKHEYTIQKMFNMLNCVKLEQVSAKLFSAR